MSAIINHDTSRLHKLKHLALNKAIINSVYEFDEKGNAEKQQCAVYVLPDFYESQWM